MKTLTRFIELRALCPLTAALLTTEVYGNAATQSNAPVPSVKNLKLSVSANGRYFVDQGGKPFFYLGDTCWLLFQRPNREELDESLKDRAAKGFTVIQAYVLRGLGQKHPDGNSSLLDSSVKAQWYDPRDGTWEVIGQYPNKGIQGFVAPSRGKQNDWVLVLDTTL